jgi:hypothetical protein
MISCLNPFWVETVRVIVSIGRVFKNIDKGVMRMLRSKTLKLGIRIRRRLITF